MKGRKMKDDEGDQAKFVLISDNFCGKMHEKREKCKKMIFFKVT